jgi:hypothetical protein
LIVYSDTLGSMESSELKRQLSDIFVKAGILTSDEHAIVKATGK